MKKFLYLFILAANYAISAPLEFITSQNVITNELAKNAIIRKEPGFETDFLILHCLVKKFQPKNLFEIGTCEGYGTLIMKNAYMACSIISLDLPPNSPPFFHKPQNIGWRCKLPYQQVYGNSLTYNYLQHYPLDAWFIDGAHDYNYVNHESKKAIESSAKLIIYHDTDIDEVLQAIIDAFKEYKNYKIYRVTDSRITYVLKV